MVDCLARSAHSAVVTLCDLTLGMRRRWVVLLAGWLGVLGGGLGGLEGRLGRGFRGAWGERAENFLFSGHRKQPSKHSLAS